MGRIAFQGLAWLLAPALCACSGNAGEQAEPGSGGTAAIASGGSLQEGSGGQSSAGAGGGGGSSESGGSVAAGGGPASTTGGSSPGGSASGGSPQGTGSSTSGGSSSGGGGPASGGSTAHLDAGCTELVNDPEIGWRESSLRTDQEIVECLASSLGRPIGYGENALGGYDPGGASQLIVITKGGATSVEQQILDAIAGDEHAWIVFDKQDFATETEVAMYRVACDESALLSALGGTAEQCRDHHLWCAENGVSGDAACLEEFFNTRLNDSALPYRIPVIGSNKTIDGRASEAFFRFSGFAIGSDSDGEPAQTSSSVILTHLRFLGAGHTEDHALDPDMIRSTGASHDIWIHKNDFDLTGDSAFDVKVGAYDITMSFNRVQNVKRASLHGSSDDRTINEQITTTMHHNAFVTTDDLYLAFGNTARRVPLLRRGKSHMWNNLFVNYRKDIMSLRVGASVLFEDNAFVVAESLQEGDSAEDSLDELQEGLIRDIEDGNLETTGNSLWFSTSSCAINPGTEREISPSFGSVDDLAAQYDAPSQASIDQQRTDAGQTLIDYVSATAGKYGAAPFNSPWSDDQATVISAGAVACQ